MNQRIRRAHQNPRGNFVVDLMTENMPIWCTKGWISTNSSIAEEDGNAPQDSHPRMAYDGA